jgi:hypothetical protein
MLQGLPPGFNIKNVISSFSDSFGVDILSSEKIGESTLEIRVSPEGAERALSEGVFHSGGNKVHNFPIIAKREKKKR